MMLRCHHIRGRRCRQAKLSGRESLLRLFLGSGSALSGSQICSLPSHSLTRSGKKRFARYGSFGLADLDIWQ